METIQCGSVVVWTYPDDAHHATGMAVGGAVGEEQVGHAVGASAGALNGLRFEAGGEQLAAVGFDQVNMQGGVGIAGDAPGNLMEEIAAVGEMGIEAGEDFFAYGVATGTDSGADGGDQVFGS